MFPAGGSPAPVSAGAPGSRVAARGEIPSTEADRRKPSAEEVSVGWERERGPQHEVKPGASTEKQSGSRAAHFTAKATSGAREPERAPGPGGVWGAARVQGKMLNSGEPSERPLSRRACTYKPKAKSARAQRQSEGTIVPARPWKHGGGKGPRFGRVGSGGKREGMTREGSNHPHERVLVDKVRRLQRRLWTAAKQSPERRFHALYDRIYRGDVLWEAWKRVKRNKGTAGVDGQTLADLEQYGVELFLEELQRELRAGEYRPKAVRRRVIPKANGGKRRLGIPAVRDRVVQMAVKLVVEPIFEADFCPDSYGFRPKRGATQALERLRKLGAQGGNHVLDADIEDYFGSIDHAKLMKLVERRISDRRVLKLLRQWLTAGVMEDGKERTMLSGTPQGGVISPLLSNIYLHVLDSVWKKRCAHLGVLVRYADDFVVVCKTKAKLEEAEQRVGIILQRLGLRLNRDKTRRANLSWGHDGFDFLGCHLRKRLSGKLWEREGRRVYFLQRWPSQRSMKRVRQRVKELTPRGRCHQDPRDVIADLNPVLRGWGQYFCTGNASKHFNAIDGHVWRRLMRLRVKRKGRHLKPREVTKWNRAYFEALGLYRLRGTLKYPETPFWEAA